MLQGQMHAQTHMDAAAAAAAQNLSVSVVHRHCLMVALFRMDVKGFVLLFLVCVCMCVCPYPLMGVV